MAGNTQEKLLDEFLTAAGQEGSRSSADRAISAMFGRAMTSQLAQAAMSPLGGKAGGSDGSHWMKFFGSGFGLWSLASELFGLFGRGDSKSPTVAKYIMPSSLSFEAADSAAGMSMVDYNQVGMPRAYGAPGQVGGSGNSNPATQAPQITINVQAMDSRSFLDRSTDIAAAVRNAMLNSNSINELVSEL